MNKFGKKEKPCMKQWLKQLFSFYFIDENQKTLKNSDESRSLSYHSWIDLEQISSEFESLQYLLFFYLNKRKKCIFIWHIWSTYPEQFRIISELKLGLNKNSNNVKKWVHFTRLGVRERELIKCILAVLLYLRWPWSFSFWAGNVRWVSWKFLINIRLWERFEQEPLNIQSV